LKFAIADLRLPISNVELLIFDWQFRRTKSQISNFKLQIGNPESEIDNRQSAIRIRQWAITKQW